LHDILIRNGRVVDGESSPCAHLDVAINGAGIVEIDEHIDGKASRVIDAEGMVVCPGFIDIHSHSELALLANPMAESKIMQGVTTELVGNCGSSPAPLLGQALEETVRLAEKLHVDIDWSSLDEYFQRVARQGTSVNVATMTGAETLRRSVVGVANVKASAEELACMNRLLAESMLQGAYGLSSGLIYAPGCYASTEELISLASTSASMGGIYASHIRGEGTTVVRAVKEAIRIGREARSRVEISHFKVCGRTNWGRANDPIRLVDAAREEGVDVVFDVHPYTASSTSLDTILPPWAREGDKKDVIARIRDPATRQRIKEDIGKLTDDWENDVAECGWENIVAVGFRGEANKRFENRSVAEIADILGKGPTDTALDLLVDEDLQIDSVLHDMSENDVETMIRNPLAAIGSDGSAESPSGPMGKYAVHPRAYGTFPRVIRHYALERKLFSTEEAIRKMTSMPAERMGLNDRGILAVGYAADIVIFNPKTIRDTATFESSQSFPEGIPTVIVNGVITVDQGVHTGERAGKVLRHKPSIA
jgi:N-acyl-D-aspartate/D-glutamate deacylase